MAQPDSTPDAGCARVTSILPLKNYHERFLRAALGSMFEQTSPNWRLLVVVEPEDAAQFKELLVTELTDCRVQLIVNAGRKLAGAINTGMMAATTPFVAILLGDDLWDRHAVEVLERAIAGNPEADFFHTARRVIDEHDRSISEIYPAVASLTLADFQQGSPVKHLLCWRRELGLAVGGVDESLNSVGPDDYDFPWVMAEHGARFHAIQECLYIYRDHRTAYRLTTHQPLDHHVREIDRILAKHGVPARERARKLRAARKGYLRQCLYRNTRDQRWKDWLGFDARRGWRERYLRPSGGPSWRGRLSHWWTVLFPRNQ